MKKYRKTPTINSIAFAEKKVKESVMGILFNIFKAKSNKIIGANLQNKPHDVITDIVTHHLLRFPQEGEPLIKDGENKKNFTNEKYLIIFWSSLPTSSDILLIESTMKKIISL
jgi:hypothetical protein